MAKKRASSAPLVHEEPICKEQKPGDEIEEIFSTKKKKKEAKPESRDLAVDDGNAEKEKMKKTKKRRKTMEKSKSKTASGLSDLPSRLRRRTKDGLVIYSAEELGIGKSDAGGTPLCPFDCSCCF